MISSSKHITLFEVCRKNFLVFFELFSRKILSVMKFIKDQHSDRVDKCKIGKALKLPHPC